MSQEPQSTEHRELFKKLAFQLGCPDIPVLGGRTGRDGVPEGLHYESVLTLFEILEETDDDELIGEICALLIVHRTMAADILESIVPELGPKPLSVLMKMLYPQWDKESRKKDSDASYSDLMYAAQEAWLECTKVEVLISLAELSADLKRGIPKDKMNRIKEILAQ